MKIDSYAITQESTLQRSLQYSETTSAILLTDRELLSLKSEERPDYNPGQSETRTPADNTLSSAAQNLARGMNVSPSHLRGSIIRANLDLRITLLEYFFARAGFRFHDPSDRLSQRLESVQQRQNDIMNQLCSAYGMAKPSQQQRMYSMAKVTTELSIEQSMSYSVAGSVRTSDGHSIEIQMDLTMSASFYSKNSVMIEAAFCDPLVVNFGAPAAALESTKFAFDINNDGQSDQISKLSAGCGFLALDKNGDGEINNGSELFGAKSGNGFADLAAYDKDKNGWIDENDAIYDKLRIWTRDESGASRLMALGEMGIGAIYLGSQQTNYALGALNDPDAMISANGFFLREDGTQGTVQQVDFRV